MIEAKELTKQYGDKRAVDGISFSVRPGIVTGFLGPNEAVTSHRTPEPSDSPGS
jgi:ABC-2 type transport system ATP-binding protein